MTKRRKYLTVFISSLLLIALAIGGYVFFAPSKVTAPSGSSNKSGQNSGTNSSQPGSQQGNSTAPQKTYPLAVYFSKHPQSDDDPSVTFPVQRVSTDGSVGKFAVTELLKGPTSTEVSQGYFSTVRLRTAASTCGGQDFKLNIAGGVATLQFCKPFDHLGVVADGQADSEIKASLKQFSTVQKVIILDTAGNCEFDLSGMNLCKQ